MCMCITPHLWLSYAVCRIIHMPCYFTWRIIWILYFWPPIVTSRFNFAWMLWLENCLKTWELSYLKFRSITCMVISNAPKKNLIRKWQHLMLHHEDKFNCRYHEKSCILGLRTVTISSNLMQCREQIGEETAVIIAPLPVIFWSCSCLSVIVCNPIWISFPIIYNS